MSCQRVFLSSSAVMNVLYVEACACDEQPSRFFSLPSLAVPFSYPAKLQLDIPPPPLQSHIAE